MSEHLTRAEAMRRDLCRGCQCFVTAGQGQALQVCGDRDTDRCPGPQPREEREEKKP